MKTQVEERFTEFYEEWVSQLEEINHQLLRFHSKNDSDETEEMEALITKATTHFKDFYAAKWVAAHEDVLAFFSPVWLSPLENAHLWFTGFKPSLTFRLLPGSGAAMSEDQGRRMQELRAKIRAEEERVERQMEEQQVAMASDPRMVSMARLAAGEQKGTAAAVAEGAVGGMLSGLEKVVMAADCVRLRALKGVLEVLSPGQKVAFLGGASMLHMEMRKWGKMRGGGHHMKPLHHSSSVVVGGGGGGGGKDASAFL